MTCYQKLCKIPTSCDCAADWLAGGCAGPRGEAARLPCICPMSPGYGLPSYNDSNAVPSGKRTCQKNLGLLIIDGRRDVLRIRRGRGGGLPACMWVICRDKAAANALIEVLAPCNAFWPHVPAASARRGASEIPNPDAKFHDPRASRGKPSSTRSAMRSAALWLL